MSGSGASGADCRAPAGVDTSAVEAMRTSANQMSGRRGNCMLPAELESRGLYQPPRSRQSRARLLRGFPPMWRSVMRWNRRAARRNPPTPCRTARVDFRIRLSCERPPEMAGRAGGEHHKFGFEPGRSLALVHSKWTVAKLFFIPSGMMRKSPRDQSTKTSWETCPAVFAQESTNLLFLCAVRTVRMVIDAVSTCSGCSRGEFHKLFEIRFCGWRKSDFLR